LGDAADIEDTADVVADADDEDVHAAGGLPAGEAAEGA
jgi:hypothetical protein